MIFKQQDERIDALKDTVQVLHGMGDQINVAIKEHDGFIYFPFFPKNE